MFCYGKIEFLHVHKIVINKGLSEHKNLILRSNFTGSKLILLSIQITLKHLKTIVFNTILLLKIRLVRKVRNIPTRLGRGGKE